MAPEKRHRVVVYLNDDLKARVDKKAEQLGLSVSGLFNIAVYDYLKQDSVLEMSDMFKAFKVEETLQALREANDEPIGNTPKAKKPKGK